jgi:hypothetical protein
MASAIERYETEIRDMLQRGMSQAQVIRAFKDRGVTIPQASLSYFVKWGQPADAATATAEDEQVSERFDAALRFQRATAEELTGRMADVIEALQQLKREGDGRFDALKALMNKPQPAKDDAGDAGMLSARIEEAIQRLDALASRTAGAGLRWVWFKAFLWASFLWAVALLGVVVYMGRANL